MSDANSQPRPISQNRDKPNATGDSSSQKQAETPESRNEIGNSASTKSTANSNARTKPKSIGHYIIGEFHSLTKKVTRISFHENQGKPLERAHLAR